MTLTPEYLRHHIDALLSLSRDIKDSAAAAKLHEMADELRIIVSVTDIADMAADLKAIDTPSASPRLPPKADVVPFKGKSLRDAPPRWRSQS